MVQWLGLCALTAEGPGSIPGWGTKIPQAAWCGKKKNKNKNNKNIYSSLKIIWIANNYMFASERNIFQQILRTYFVLGTVQGAEHSSCPYGAYKL